MNEKQIWQTIVLDLKRAANYMHLGRQRQADYYLNEAKKLYEQCDTEKMRRVADFIKFDGNPEDLLLGSSLILGRI
jgi:hypothetical protein